MAIGLVCSTFDLLHAGHMLMLADAKRQCTDLIVGLQSDASTTPKSYRGKLKDKPIMSLVERKILLEGNKYVDEYFVYNTEKDLLKVIKTLPDHTRILGSDWKGKKATGQEFAKKIYYHKRDHDYSTTALKDKIKKLCKK